MEVARVIGLDLTRVFSLYFLSIFLNRKAEARGWGSGVREVKTNIQEPGGPRPIGEGQVTLKARHHNSIVTIRPIRSH